MHQECKCISRAAWLIGRNWQTPHSPLLLGPSKSPASTQIQDEMKHTESLTSHVENARASYNNLVHPCVPLQTSVQQLKWEMKSVIHTLHLDSYERTVLDQKHLKAKQ